MLFNGSNLNYYTCKKINNGSVESEIIISFASGDVSMVYNGNMIVDKDERLAIIDKVSRSLNTVNSLLKSKE